MADDSLLKHISVSEIVSDKSPWNGTPSWKVTVLYTPSRDFSPITAVFHLEKSDYLDDGLIAVAKNYFHGLTSKLGADTAEWKLSQEQIEAFKKPKKS